MVTPEKNGDCEEDRIKELVSQGKWINLLEDHDKNSFLPWIWPNLQDLKFIRNSALDLEAERIISIGCGSALLEWLIIEATGIPVKGIEFDKSWWNSKYSTKFLPLEFTSDFSKGYPVASKKDALMFCYFNNEAAFLDYLRHYQGPCLIVIGPGCDRGTHTNPTPFYLPHPAAEEWVLHDIQEVKSGKDFTAVFRRT